MAFKKFDIYQQYAVRKSNLYQKMLEADSKLKDTDTFHKVGRQEDTSSLIYHIERNTVLVNPQNEGPLNPPAVYIIGDEEDIPKAISKLEKITNIKLFEVSR